MEKGANQNLTQNDEVHRTGIKSFKVSTYDDDTDFIDDEEQDIKVYDKCDDTGNDCTINQTNVAVIGKYLLIRYNLRQEKEEGYKCNAMCWFKCSQQNSSFVNM